ncbi:hypothetical protein CEUSTIGMA_g1942.t1 [Chlamydomonas eustigma]|uniref:Uncharacterized protein n=1 Tax=Chlamydomonas eustigma TaxID=1157962 RepID=A0A250WUI3_9CHLO|nr:hypothetical protein CEUSTIGMA_g1942.t1 [Chlamydomonas eustigma]|eukprot:GAX74493.1 hypothetical protein CEUSTIGMA_g1942.t1 [Chlamydomonas eustigma]
MTRATRKRSRDKDIDIADIEPTDSSGGSPETSEPSTGSENLSAGDLKRTRTSNRSVKNADETCDFDQNGDIDVESTEDSDAEDVEDNSNTHCEICAMDKEPDKLLLCEACPRVYHLYCLDPPLKHIPKGDWFCKSCLSSMGLLNIEKVLDSRDIATGTSTDAGLNHDAGTHGSTVRYHHREFYVKWKGKSHMHCSWVSEEALQSALKVFKGPLAQAVQQKLRKFLSSQSSSYGIDDADNESQITGEVVNGVNQQWLVVDRIIAERGGTGVTLSAESRDSQNTNTLSSTGTSISGGKVSTACRLEYLVKWKELGYDACTWESYDDLRENWGSEISAFKARQKSIKHSVAELRQLSQEQALSAKMPPSTAGSAICNSSDSIVLPASSSSITAIPDVETASDADHRGLGQRKFSETPPWLKGGELHPYQIEGLNWLYYKRTTAENVILGDEMGLGKTVQTIAYLSSLHYCDFVERPFLVVVPLSTIRNWEREFAIWAPDLNVVNLVGNSSARRIILEHEMYTARVLSRSKSHSSEADRELDGGSRKDLAHGNNNKLQDRVKFHVLLTTYEMVLSEIGQLSKLEYEVLVVDEGHRLKNKESRLFQDLKQLRCVHKVLLTGTPLQNNISELFMLLHFLEKEKFASVEQFEQQFSDLGQERQVARLHELLSPHLLRRLKKDVLKNKLPPKQEQIVRVELSRMQREFYRNLLARHYPVLVAGSSSSAATNSSRPAEGRPASNKMSALKNLMMELRKCCNHPYLFDGAEQQGIANGQSAIDPLQALISNSGKLELVDRMVSQLIKEGHRILIYSQFTRTLDILEDWLRGRKWGHVRIDGSIAGAERQRRIDRFNLLPDQYSVFLLSTRAGGLGINLATADTVIIYDSDWNPHNDLQAQARAHRLGQLKPVMIYRLVSRATIEERMMQVSRKKMVLEHLVVRKMVQSQGGSSNNGHISSSGVGVGGQRSSEGLKQSELDDILRRLGHYWRISTMLAVSLSTCNLMHKLHMHKRVQPAWLWWMAATESLLELLELMMDHQRLNQLGKGV